MLRSFNQLSLNVGYRMMGFAISLNSRSINSGVNAYLVFINDGLTARFKKHMNRRVCLISSNCKSRHHIQQEFNESFQYKVFIGEAVKLGKECSKIPVKHLM